MDLFVKILKISAVLLFIFVLVVLCAPSSKGPFILIHFATTLNAWMAVQLLFLALALAGRSLLGTAVAVQVRALGSDECLFRTSTPAVMPLRC